MTIISKVNKFVKSKYDNDEYNWIHNEFVTKHALKLGKLLEADLEILEIAARLHDIDFSRGKKFHTEDSAKLAEKFLKKEGYPSKKIEQVKLAIMCHTHSIIKTIKRPSLEGKILHDADKMWLLTPAGIARAIAHRYKENTSYEFIIKTLNKLLNFFSELQFDTSRKMIKKDYELCRKFVEGLKDV